MEIREEFWDGGFGDNRSEEEWARLLSALRDSLADYLGQSVDMGPYELDDEKGDRCKGISACIRVRLSESIGLVLLGSLAISWNVGRGVSADAILLLFCDGRRMAEHRLSREGMGEIVSLEFEPSPDSLGIWSSRLYPDESGEWERLMTRALCDEEGM